MVKDETMEKILKLVNRMSAEQAREVGEACHHHARSLQRQEARELTRSIQIGDEVVFRQVKPKYLDGTRARFLGWKGSKMRVELIEPIDPRAASRFGRVALAPPTIIRKAS